MTARRPCATDSTDSSTLSDIHIEASIPWTPMAYTDTLATGQEITPVLWDREGEPPPTRRSAASQTALAGHRRRQDTDAHRRRTYHSTYTPALYKPPADKRIVSQTDHTIRAREYHGQIPIRRTHRHCFHRLLRLLLYPWNGYYRPSRTRRSRQTSVLAQNLSREGHQPDTRPRDIHTYFGVYYRGTAMRVEAAGMDAALFSP